MWSLRNLWPFNRKRLFVYRKRPDTGWIEQSDGTFFRGLGAFTYLITAEQYAQMKEYRKWEADYFASQDANGPRLADLPIYKTQQ